MRGSDTNGPLRMPVERRDGSLPLSWANPRLEPRQRLLVFAPIYWLVRAFTRKHGSFGARRIVRSTASPWFDFLTNMEAVVDGPNFNCFRSSFSPSVVRGTISDCRIERCSSRRPLPAIGGAQPTVRWCPAHKRAKAAKESISYLVQAELPIHAERGCATLTEEPRG
jgi:hypothetical protein